MPLQATSGAASYDAFGGGVPVVPAYIEEVFSTYLYTGNGSTQTITNGIDLAGKGGLVWLKNRTGGSGPHNWYTTAIGSASYLDSSQTSGLATYQEALSTYNSDGFSLSSGAAGGNENTFTYASWTFRKQPKFFDIVTYTGTGSATTIAHNLGSVPGCIIVKRTDSAGFDWAVYHTSTGNTQRLLLNTTDPAGTSSSFWNNTTPTSTVFTVGSNVNTNASGGTYVAYLFAHNAGGFGLTGTDNVISCGSFTCDGSGNADVTLGYEPQWLLVKPYDASGYPWYMGDIMRGMPLTGDTRFLRANTSGAETGDGGVATFRPTATGFQVRSFSQANIYIAIRRGPMKVPTSGTSVFNSVARTGDRLAGSLTGIGFNPDSLISLVKTGGYQHEWNNKLAGSTNYLRTTTNESEFTSTDLKSYDQDGISFNATDFNSIVNRISPLIQYFLKRAPSVFDIVCYTGTAANRTVSHNLSVVPELMIVKQRSASGENWNVYSATLTATKYLTLNLTNAEATDSLRWNDTAPTSSVFSLGTRATVNGSGTTFVAYLFSTCAGVSKVGSYTGTGALQTINCGFTSGARFILIKRTDSTGSWWLYDSTRGISSSDDPYLFLNSNAAEVTNTNYVDTDTTGFKVTAAAPADLNSSGGTYIFLAIA